MQLMCASPAQSPSQRASHSDLLGAWAFGMAPVCVMIPAASSSPHLLRPDFFWRWAISRLHLAQLPAQSSAEIPLWMMTDLYQRDMVQPRVPKCYNQRRAETHRDTRRPPRSAAAAATPADSILPPPPWPHLPHATTASSPLPAPPAPASSLASSCPLTSLAPPPRLSRHLNQPTGSEQTSSQRPAAPRSGCLAPTTTTSASRSPCSYGSPPSSAWRAPAAARPLTCFPRSPLLLRLRLALR